MDSVQIEAIVKEKIKNLYESNPQIHINVYTTKPKLNFQNLCATIKGVYPHIFRIEVSENSSIKSFCVQYSDVVTNKVQILELK